MGIRTTPQELRSLLDLDTSASVFGFIQIASRFVDDRLANQSITPVMLSTLELLLAAHFYSVHEPEIEQQSYSDASYRYSVAKKGQGLSATSWGQQAIALDPSGVLSEMGKRLARFESV